MAVETRNFYPDLQRKETPTASGSTVVSYISDLGPDSCILTLIHGYPQSAFEWRHVIPALLGKVSLFVPELPGYGISTPAKDNSRRAIGTALLDALCAAFSLDASHPRDVILGGHDRGARLCHRLAVWKGSDAAFFPSLNLKGAILIDILPTKVQWETFSDPTNSMAYFHWPLLANVDRAVPMLMALGGGNWCRAAHEAIAGPDDAGRQRIKADGAVDVYATLFDKEETLRYSCLDYAAGAAPECADQAADQAAGRKLAVPTVVMFSEQLNKKADVAETWKGWVVEGVSFEPVAVLDGHGHYLPEEAPEIVSTKILNFIGNHRA